MRRVLFSLLISIAVAKGASCPSSALGASHLRVVAHEGAFIPGSTTEVYWDFEIPVINDLGHVAVHANYEDVNTGALGDVFIAENASGLDLVAHEFDDAPGLPSNPSLMLVDFKPQPLALTNSGQTLFMSEYGFSRTDSSDGIWSHSDSGVSLVTVGGGPLENVSGYVGHRLPQPRFPDLRRPLFNEAGQTAFIAPLFGRFGTIVTAANNEGIVLGSADPLRLIVRKGDPAPGLASDIKFGGFEDLALNDSGEIGFTANLTNQNPGAHGVWSTAGGSLQMLAGRGDAAPGVAAPLRFGNGFGDQRGDTFSGVSINNSGQVAFRGFLEGIGVTAATNAGIWANRTGPLSLVVREGDQAAGAPTGVNYFDPADPLLNNAGDIAFISSLSGAGVDANNDSGICLQRNGSMELIVREGDQAVGLSDGVAFSDFSSLLMNDSGQIAFLASYGGAEIGRGDGFSLGIWATDRTGQLRKVFRLIERVEVSPGNSLAFTSLSFAGDARLANGQFSAFNNLGQIAFTAGNGDYLFVSNAAAVPEPGLASSLVVLAGIWVVIHRRAG